MFAVFFTFYICSFITFLPLDCLLHLDCLHESLETIGLHRAHWFIFSLFSFKFYV